MLVLQHNTNVHNMAYRAVSTSDLDLLENSDLSVAMKMFFDVRLFRTRLPLDSGGAYTVDDWNVLHVAVYMGKSALVEALLQDLGADVNSETLSYRLSPLLIAIAKGFHGIMQLLLAHGADPNYSSGR